MRLLFQSSSGDFFDDEGNTEKTVDGGGEYGAKVYIVIEMAVMAFEVFIIIWGKVGRGCKSVFSLDSFG